MHWRHVAIDQQADADARLQRRLQRHVGLYAGAARAEVESTPHDGFSTIERDQRLELDELAFGLALLFYLIPSAGLTKPD